LTVFNEYVNVVGFDPGESTGFVVLGIDSTDLMDPATVMHEAVDVLAAGTINCHGAEGQALAVHKHAGLNIFGENTGIQAMVDVVSQVKLAAVVVEDFIPDFKKMDQARHTLSPVRLMAGFSYGLYAAWQEWDMHPVMGLPEERIFIQNRSLAKTTFTQERLVNLGLDLKGQSRHARDAMKHAFYFLRNCHNKTGQIEKSAEMRHLAWPHLFDDPMITAKPKKVRAPRPKGERI
jgi:hypothetical protein